MYRRHLLLGLPALLLPAASGAQASGLTVFAAASLTEVLGDVDKAWQAAGNPPLHLSFASSSVLAQQIQQGAPAQIFASADEQWADWLEIRNLLVPGTRKDLLTNSLVLVVPKSAARHIQTDSKLDLSALLGPTGRLAVGDPASVPAGIYAKQPLAKLGL